MGIVTVAYSPFTPGNELAQKAATLLGYRFVSREALMQMAGCYGISDLTFFRDWNTKTHWYDRWQNRKSIDHHRVVLQASLFELCKRGNVVYCGHVGQEFLSGVAHLLRVCLIAPCSWRVRQVCMNMQLNEIKARQYIDRVDKSYDRRYQTVFRVDWRDPARFDVMLNGSVMTLDTAANIVADTVRREEYQPTSKSERMFQNLMIIAKIKALIGMSPKLRSAVINVQVEDGHAFLYGMIFHDSWEEEIVNLVKSVQGVSRVSTEFQIIAEDSMYL